MATLLLVAELPFVSFADEMTTQATNTTGAPVTTNAPTAVFPATPAPVFPAATTTADPNSIYSLTVNSLDGKPVDLHQYMGHVALVINTASKSGHAEQFAGLEKLYETYKDKGFVVLDFPSNDFGQLEPGTAKEIAERYATFKLTFPIFETVRVRGDGQSPVYRLLATGHKLPTWNFHKYLVDKTGKVIGEFPSQMKPDNKDLQNAIEAALK
jgi:glutathione peroxidase